MVVSLVKISLKSCASKNVWGIGPNEEARMIDPGLVEKCHSGVKPG
jgi:hypothetical protein